MERKFEWDPEKEASNRDKHGLGFALARRVFQDPFRLTKRDTRFEYNEDRYVTLGVVEKRLFVVVYTYRGDAPASSLFGKPICEKESVMTSVRKKLDLDDPGALSAVERTDLDRVDQIADRDIDYSDIPELDETFWSDAVRDGDPPSETAKERSDRYEFEIYRDREAEYRVRFKRGAEIVFESRHLSRDEALSAIEAIQAHSRSSPIHQL